MGFQVADSYPNPDLLFSYFIQDSPELTVESEILVCLKSPYAQFIDPETNAWVAAADCFYTEIINSATSETGVKALFASLQQQILYESKPETEKPIAASSSIQSATSASVVPLSPVPTV